MSACVRWLGLGDGDPSVTNLEMQPEPRGAPGTGPWSQWVAAPEPGHWSQRGDTDTRSLEISKARGNKTSSKM